MRELSSAFEAFSIAQVYEESQEIVLSNIFSLTKRNTNLSIDSLANRIRIKFISFCNGKKTDFLFGRSLLRGKCADDVHDTENPTTELMNGKSVK